MSRIDWHRAYGGYCTAGLTSRTTAFIRRAKACVSLPVRWMKSSASMPVGWTWFSFSSPFSSAPVAGTSSSEGFDRVAARVWSPAKLSAGCCPKRSPSIAPGTPWHSESK